MSEPAITPSSTATPNPAPPNPSAPPALGVAPGGEATPPAAAPPAPEAKWYDGLPDDVRGYIEHKNFKDLSALATSYRSLEKLHGVPADKLVRLPESDDSAEWGAVYAKLGRPERPDGYTVEVPEGGSKDFAEWAQGTFHELGLTKRQGEALAAKWGERMESLKSTVTQGLLETQEAQLSTLKTEWGQAFNQNLERVNQFAKAVGLTTEQAQGMSRVLGVDGLNKLLHGVIEKFGIELGEHGFKGANGNNSFGVLTPAGAVARIEALKGDPEFTKRYLGGDVQARAEMHRLHQWAYPEADE